MLLNFKNFQHMILTKRNLVICNRKYGEILLSTYSFRQRNTSTSQRDKEALEGNDDAANDDAPYVRRNAILVVNAIYKLPQGDNLLVDAPEMIEKMLTTEANQ
ncbi:hypothetical protein Hanom_Chr06g00482341 [Helianthus anomalus]